jgi:Cilia- and flagella-associated protein 61, N-terminal domain
MTSTRWLSCFVADSLYEQDSADAMLSTVFSTLPDLEAVLSCLPDSVPVFCPLTEHFDLATPDNPSGSDVGDFQTYVLHASQFCPLAHVRPAAVEDHDDLVPLLNENSQILTATYGEFFLSDLIEAQEPQRNVSVVAEVSSRAIGLMSLTTDVDLRVLRRCFDLELYDDFRKSESVYDLRAGQSSYSLHSDAGSEDDRMSFVSSASTVFEDSSQSNVFGITMCCIEQNYTERVYLQLLEAAFEAFPGRNYCLLTVPFTVVEPHLRFFSAVQPKASATFSHALYVVHRAAVRPQLSIRNSVPEDSETIQTLFGNVPELSALTCHPDDAAHPARTDAPIDTKSLVNSPSVIESIAEEPTSIAVEAEAPVQLPRDDTMSSLSGLSAISADSALEVATISAEMKGVPAGIESVAASEAANVDAGSAAKVIESTSIAKSEHSTNKAADVSEQVTHSHIVIECEGQIIGFAAVNDMSAEALASTRAAFDLETAVHVTISTNSAHVLQVATIVLNPIFAPHIHRIIAEILRCRNATVAVHVRQSPSQPRSAIVTNSFTLATKRHVCRGLAMSGGVIDLEDTEAHSSSSVYVASAATLACPKINISSRIVIVGASSTSFSFLRHLLTQFPDIVFPNIVLISDNHDVPQHSSLEEFMPRFSLFTEADMDSLDIASSVHFVHAHVDTIVAASKTIVLDSGAHVLYDWLVLTPGLQDQLQHDTDASLKQATEQPEHGLPLYSVSFASDIERVASTLADTVAAGSDLQGSRRVCVYGSTAEAIGMLLHLASHQELCSQLEVVWVGTSDSTNSANWCGGSNVVHSRIMDFLNAHLELTCVNGLELVHTCDGTPLPSQEPDAVDAAQTNDASQDDTNTEATTATADDPDDTSKLTQFRGAVFRSALAIDQDGKHTSSVEAQTPLQIMPLQLLDHTKSTQIGKNTKPASTEPLFSLSCAAVVSCAGHALRGSMKITSWPVHARDIDRDIFNAIVSNGFVYDGRIVVDEHFRVQNAHVLAAGPAAKFSRRVSGLLKGSPHHETYSSEEVGIQLASSLIQLMGVHQFASEQSMLAAQYDIAKLGQAKPCILRMNLPQNMKLFVMNSPYFEQKGTSSHSAIASDEADSSLVTSNQDEQRYFCMDFNSSHELVRIVYFGVDTVDFVALSQLYRLRSSYFNDIFARYQREEFDDLMTFLSWPSARPLLHDRFNAMRQELLKIVLTLPDVKSIVDSVVSTSGKDESVVNKLATQNVYGRLDVSSKKVIQRKLWELLEQNRDQLPEYVFPDIVQYHSA